MMAPPPSDSFTESELSGISNGAKFKTWQTKYLFFVYGVIGKCEKHEAQNTSISYSVGGQTPTTTICMEGVQMMIHLLTEELSVQLARTTIFIILRLQHVIRPATIDNTYL